MWGKSLSLTLLTAAIAIAPLLTKGVATAPTGLRLIHSDETGIVVELHTPAYTLTPVDATTGSQLLLEAPGLPTSAEPGRPRLPVAGALLGIPPDAEVTLDILADQVETVPLPAPLATTKPPSPLEETTPSMETIFSQTGSHEERPRNPQSAIRNPKSEIRNPQSEIRNPQFHPPAPAELGSPAWLRDQRLVRLALYPFQYRASTGELRHHRYLRVAIRFHYSTESPIANRQSPIARIESAFEGVLRHVLFNYDAARAWRAPEFPGVPPSSFGTNAEPHTQPPQTTALKLIVAADGIYRVTPDDFRAAGLDPTTVDPRTFALTCQGLPVAIRVAGEADGHFDPRDYVEFYGRKLTGDHMITKYSDENVYWLTWGGEPGPRMDAVDGTPTGTAPVPTSFVTTHHAEEQVIWWTHHTTTLDTRDTWWWQRLTVYGLSGGGTFTTTLRGVAAEPYTATVRAEVLPRRVSDNINPDHHTRLYLNDLPDPIDDSLFDGKVRKVFTATVPQAALNGGINSLYFEIINDLGLPMDDIYFNWFEVDYHRTYTAEGDVLRFSVDTPGTWQFEISGFSTDDLLVYDVTDPLHPTRILSPTVTAESDTYRLIFETTSATKPQYLALSAAHVRPPERIERFTPSGLRDAANGADYIFITHADFMTETQRLADYRAAQGLRVKVVDVATLYDEFNDGIFHPVAIHNFLDYAYHHWQPPPPIYVLLVGDGHWNFKNHNPAKYGSPDPVFIPPYLAWVDPWQGEVGADHLFACVHGDDILPDMLIGRLAVNSSAQAKAMVDKIIAYEAASPSCADPWQRRALFVADNADGTGDYPAVSDDVIASYLPPNYEIQRVYLGVTHAQPDEATQAIVENLNRGALLANYMGHGSVDWWTHERIWVPEDIASLDNGDRLPLVLTFDCLDGYFIYPGRSCIAEEMTRAEGKGSIVSWSPAGLGEISVQRVLAGAFYTALFEQGLRQIGATVAAAKATLFAALGENELIYTQTLFGDPALTLQQPPHCSYLPVTLVFMLHGARKGMLTCLLVYLCTCLPICLCTPNYQPSPSTFCASSWPAVARRGCESAATAWPLSSPQGMR